MVLLWTVLIYSWNWRLSDTSANTSNFLALICACVFSWSFDFGLFRQGKYSMHHVSQIRFMLTVHLGPFSVCVHCCGLVCQSDADTQLRAFDSTMQQTVTSHWTVSVVALKSLFGIADLSIPDRIITPLMMHLSAGKNFSTLASIIQSVIAYLLFLIHVVITFLDALRIVLICTVDGCVTFSLLQLVGCCLELSSLL